MSLHWNRTAKLELRRGVVHLCCFRQQNVLIPEISSVYLCKKAAQLFSTLLGNVQGGSTYQRARIIITAQSFKGWIENVLVLQKQWRRKKCRHTWMAKTLKGFRHLQPLGIKKNLHMDEYRKAGKTGLNNEPFSVFQIVNFFVSWKCCKCCENSFEPARLSALMHR